MIRRLNTLSSKDTAANRLVAANTLSTQTNSLPLTGFSLAPDQTRRYLLRTEFEITVAATVTVALNGGNRPGSHIVSRSNAALSGNGQTPGFMCSGTVAADTKFYAETILQYVTGIGWFGMLNSVHTIGTAPSREINTWFFPTTSALTSIQCFAAGSNFKVGSKFELFEYYGALG